MGKVGACPTGGCGLSVGCFPVRVWLGEIGVSSQFVVDRGSSKDVQKMVGVQELSLPVQLLCELRGRSVADDRDGGQAEGK